MGSYRGLAETELQVEGLGLVIDGIVGAGANVLVFGRCGNAGSASARDALVLSTVPSYGA